MFQVVALNRHVCLHSCNVHILLLYSLWKLFKRHFCIDLKYLYIRKAALIAFIIIKILFEGIAFNVTGRRNYNLSEHISHTTKISGGSAVKGLEFVTPIITTNSITFYIFTYLLKIKSTKKISQKTDS